jgi:hypothetical protein
VRLAERVFAPHYAAPMSRALSAAAALMSAPKESAEPLAELAQGDVFEVLEISGGWAWGVAPGRKLVGYVEASKVSQA